MRNTIDPHDEFKKYFVAVVKDYTEDPTDKKQTRLSKLVRESIELDEQLLYWFNAMFKWRNTPQGLDVGFRIQPPKIPN